ncbi:Asp23/Gls24 family envelope stress response protein [Merdibacter massiliensis]|uniref:hypothetical protein n=1 Tax=Merdibacter massiliensis TaxID=1871030 RepID=UPI00096A4FC9|nr:hypothetical protein [Merdibacter massiliensis]
MAQDYIVIQPQNDIGIVALNKSVFTTIAKIAVDEDDAIILNEGGGLFKYPISCKLVDNKMVLTIDIKVKYTVNVSDACSKLQKKIFESISHMSEYTPEKIDIRVVGFVF